MLLKFYTFFCCEYLKLCHYTGGSNCAVPLATSPFVEQMSDTCLTLVFKNVVSQTAEARTDVVSLLHRCRVSHPAIQEILSHNSCQAKRLQVNLPADNATGSRNDIWYGNQI